MMKLKQNKKINEKAFDNFKWTAEENADVSNPKLFPVQLFIRSSGKEVCIWMRTLPGATTLLPDPLKALHFLGFERSSRNQYKFYMEKCWSVLLLQSRF